jgi:hypothetical protein
MALGAGITALGVIGDLIRVKDVGSVVDLSLAPQLENRAILFLLLCPHGDLFTLGCGGSAGERAGLRRGRKQLAGN